MPRFAGIDKSGRNVGEIIKLGTGSLPFGFLTCDGSAISRTAYASLFSVIGTTYGTGDGSNTFNLPDLRGRFPVGDGAGIGLTTRLLGQLVGAETHTIGQSNLPLHTHGTGTLAAANTDLTGHSHSGTSGSSNQSLNHSHTQSAHNHSSGAGNSNWWSRGGNVGLEFTGGAYFTPGPNDFQDTMNTATPSIQNTDLTGHTHNMTTGDANSSLNHSHTLSGATDNGGFANSSVNHMNPALCVRFAIAYL
jgi:microcystin-dependent protein